MSRRIAFPLLLGVALALPGCASLGASKSALKCKSGGSAIDTAKACATWRWIGVTQPGVEGCPDLPGWSPRPLFPGLVEPPACGRSRATPSPIRDDVGWAAQVESVACAPSKPFPSREVYKWMQRICVYEPAELGKKAPKPPWPLSTPTGLVRLDPDCAGVSAEASGELGPMLEGALQARFDQEVGILGVTRNPKAEKHVRLAFLDTYPTGVGLPDPATRDLPHATHGLAMAHVAGRILCDSEKDRDCTVKITTRQALSHQAFDAEKPKRNLASKNAAKGRTEGGSLGTHAELAAAIREEVDAWLRADRDKRLILNLSLGWDPALFGGLAEASLAEAKAGVQAVYLALRYASEHGALVVAAAGNHRPGPCPGRGPLLPAGWEGAVPPFPLDCEQDPGVPLIYAAGGMQANGSCLANSRPGGIPPRVAYADHAVVAGLPAITGTSVAAAVVSAIAAAVWQSDPTLDASAVMGILKGSGEQLGALGSPNFPTGANLGGPVAQVSLCSALRAVNSNGTYLLEGCPVELPPVVELPDEPKKRLPPLEPAPRVEGPCSAGQILYVPNGSSGAAPVLCPADRFGVTTAKPWVYPQPPKKYCAYCSFAADPARPGVFELHLEDLELGEWAGNIWLDEVCLQLELSGSPVTSPLCVAVGAQSPLGARDVIEFEIPTEHWRAGTKVIGATATWRIFGEGYDQTPLLMLPFSEEH